MANNCSIITESSDVEKREFKKTRFQKRIQINDRQSYLLHFSFSLLVLQSNSRLAGPNKA